MAVLAKTPELTNEQIQARRLPVRLLFAGLIDAALLWLIWRFVDDGNYPLAAVFLVLVVLVTVSFSFERLRAYRWMCAGLCLTVLFVLYPVLYTFYLSTTNTGQGHILTKQQAIDFLERTQYVPEGGLSFRWTAYRADDGTYTLWLSAPNGEAYVTRPDTETMAASPGANGVGALDDAGTPVEIDGAVRLERRDLLTLLDPLSRISFGLPPNVVQVTSLTQAATTQRRYSYHAGQDSMTDNSTGIVYRPANGAFVAESGEQLRPGFFVDIGTTNFTRFFSSAALRGPLTTIVIWNFVYAILSVVFSFTLGLFIAVLFNDLPGKKIIRTLLIIPYPIPALVSILIWRNLLNPEFGALVKLQEALFGAAPRWLTDPTATRAAIILINVWLSYPYFYIITSGALQAIPAEMLDAAAVDGANVRQRFTRITLPLLLRIVGPILVASFAFNFNNFNLIYIFNQGNPPIAGSPIPAGSTDILISFVYQLGFENGQADYGLAAAISIVLFVFVAFITIVQFRYTRVLQEQG
jgi:arabinogalactan oligomer / maltooligosaccharide transport system permease protein